jgi:Fuc2NAc and GlcNAc transferase
MWAAPIAFLATLAATPLVRGLAVRLGLLDHPNERSLHQTVTPRGGGLAILVGTGVALLAPVTDWTLRRDLLTLALGAGLLALVGALDDRRGLHPGAKLLAQLAAAWLPTSMVGGLPNLPLPPPLDLPLGPNLGRALALLWVVALVNTFNFMDGIDGLASLQALLTAGGLGLALLALDPSVATVALAIMGACLAFLLFNWSPASIFLGDAGSGMIGYSLAVLPLLAPPRDRSMMVALVGTSLFLFFADVGTCLMRRALRGERIHRAHRTHLYQRWVAAGASHATVTLRLAAGGLVLTSLALLARWREGPAWQWSALLGGVALFSLEWVWVRRLERGLACVGGDSHLLRAIEDAGHGGSRDRIPS